MAPYTLQSPPRSEDELMLRVRKLAGKTFGQVAADIGETVPTDQRHAKGWLGQLVEACLGATAGSRSVPDFESIGVELKTLPIDATGVPTESTFVCVTPMGEKAGTSWEESPVYRKLKRVLWLPVQAHIPMLERRIAAGFLWSPDAQEYALLKADWDELMGMVLTGHVDDISGHQGEVLQIRPKAANASAETWGIGVDGGKVRTLPRGFYLRPAFTRAILHKNLMVRG